MELGKKYISGVFDDDGVLLKAITEIRSKGIKIEEVYTPFPVHHLEDALGYKRSRLPIVAFLFGITGTTLALVMQISMLVVDWPMIIGGKPFFSYPDFVPVAFELSVLLSAFGMVGTFFVRSDLKPYKKPRIFDLRSTDDVHIMAVDLAANSSFSEEKIKAILTESGAVEVNNKEFED
jgi:hypothetical protein